MSAAPVSSNAGDDLRIVFFGPPGAGKTALLAVLGQSQEHQLQGKLTDSSQALGDLVKAVGKPSTAAAKYPVTFQPIAVGGRDQPGATAVLLDSPGTHAAAVLAQPWDPEQHAPDTGLSGAVFKADALVLTLDASATPEQLETDFESFGEFLLALEAQRGRRLHATGMPVFLVLTKCDLLTKPNDTAIDWMEHIEERKRDVDEQFCSYLKRRGDTPAFGGIVVHCWATATKRPVLAGAVGRSQESYGVAELFRQCLEEAMAYQQRRQRARQRTSWAVAATITLVLVMAGLAVWGALHHGRMQSNLEHQVETLQLRDRPTAGERLNTNAKRLAERAVVFQKVHDDAAFDALPAPDQQFVKDRLDELYAYLAFRDKVPAMRVLMDIRSLDALERKRDDLNQLQPDPAWADTEAVQSRAARLKDLDALKDAVLKAERSYRDATDRAVALLEPKAFSPESDWLDSVRDVLAADPTSTFVAARPIPGTTSITYGTALAFNEVAADRLAWEKRRGALLDARDLIAATGLAGQNTQPPPVLDIPRNFTLKDAADRAAQLKKDYPRLISAAMLRSLPDEERSKIMRRAGLSYENLLRPARELVWMKAGADEAWDNLRAAGDLDDWRPLAKVLAGLSGGAAVDPVDDLDHFLSERDFPIRPTRLVLEVPENSLPLARPLATSVLTIEYRPRGENTTRTISLALDNTKTAVDRDAHLTRFEFKRTAGSDLLYEPGSELTASVNVVDDRRLTWKNPRASRVYQFERLVLPPVLHRENQPVADGSVEPGIRLRAVKDDELPHCPALLHKPRP